MLIVELVTLWFALAVAVGLPLGSRIRRADAAEFPLRQEMPWWFTTTPSPDFAEIPTWLFAERPVRPELMSAPLADYRRADDGLPEDCIAGDRPLAQAPALS